MGRRQYNRFRVLCTAGALDLAGGVGRSGSLRKSDRSTHSFTISQWYFLQAAGDVISYTPFLIIVRWIKISNLFSLYAARYGRGESVIPESNLVQNMLSIRTDTKDFQKCTPQRKKRASMILALLPFVFDSYLVFQEPSLIILAE